jgi:hypothetical protein
LIGALADGIRRLIGSTAVERRVLLARAEANEMNRWVCASLLFLWACGEGEGSRWVEVAPQAYVGEEDPRGAEVVASIPARPYDNAAMRSLRRRAVRAIDPDVHLQRIGGRAELVVRARLDAIDTRTAADGTQMPAGSMLSFRVLEVLKGKHTGDDLVLEVPGGVVGDRFVSIAHGPSFRKGDEAVLFLRRGDNPRSKFDLVNGAEGVASIAKNGRARVLEGEVLLESVRKAVQQ